MPKRFRFTPDWSGNPFCFFFQKQKDWSAKRENGLENARAFWFK
jgi:hypothetical protein